MKCAVTVYQFRDLDESDDAGRQLWNCEPALFGGLSVHLDRVATVVIDGAGLSYAEVAARAWIEAVGRDRQARSLELGAPAWIVNAVCDQSTIAAALCEAPAGFPGPWNFIFNDRVESWFIELDGEWVADQPASALPAQRPQGLHAAGHEPTLAVLRSLWEPGLN